MANYVIINSELYKLTAKDAKRLNISTGAEKKEYCGNKLVRHTTEDTDEILSYIIETYKPIPNIIGLFTV
jgi:hypothetical protein